MRIFLINWDNGNKDFVDVALELEKRGHEIVYWVGTKRQNFEINKQEFPKGIFHHYQDAGLAIPPKEFEEMDFEPPGGDFIRQFYETESTVLSIFRKFQRQKMSVMEMKHIYYRYLQYWYGVIQKLKPDIIIFELWPHGGYDFVIYSLAKFLRIKTLMFDFTRISDRLLLINDFIIGSPALRKEIEKNQDKQFTVEDLNPDIQESYKKQTKNGIGAVPSDLKMILKKYSGKSLLFIKLKMILKSIFDFSIFKKTFCYISKKFQPNLKKEYNKLQMAPDFNKKFIYTAFQFQPEASTSVLGGVFIDQILMVKILSASVPDDWLIYVKENPCQWLPEGTMFTPFRYRSYYETIAKLKNVRLVPVETSTFGLIEKSQAVATVTGTVGWEAVLRSKPALVFGYAWYRDCPGVFKVNNVKSCKETIENIKNNFIINEQDIINYLYSLDKVSCCGYFGECFKKQPNVRGAELTKSLLSVLVKEIEGGSF